VEGGRSALATEATPVCSLPPSCLSLPRSSPMFFFALPFGSVARRGCLAATASCLLVQPSSVRMAGSEPHERLCRLHGPPAGVGGTASFEATTRSRPGKNLLRHAILKWIQVFLLLGFSVRLALSSSCPSPFCGRRPTGAGSAAPWLEGLAHRPAAPRLRCRSKARVRRCRPCAKLSEGFGRRMMLPL
jgi:hypothetical protein